MDAAQPLAQRGHQPLQHRAVARHHGRRAPGWADRLELGRPPTDRLDELAVSGWGNAQLHDDDLAEANGLPAAAGRAGQLRAFLDGYGALADDRVGLVDRMIEFAIRDCAALAEIKQITPKSTDSTTLWTLAWQTRAAAWRLRHRSMLERAILG
jgi:hypothetical protein